MSTPVAHLSLPAAPAATGKFLAAGLVGLALTAVGVAVSGAQQVAYAYLVGFSFWAAIAIGMMMLILVLASRSAASSSAFFFASE